MNKLIKIALLSFLLSSPVLAEDDVEGPILTSWQEINNACDNQWTHQHQNHLRHIGRAACGCVADIMSEYAKTHEDVDPSSQEYTDFYTQTSEICMTSGVFSNTADRADFFNIYGQQDIENICNSSWVGLMGSFKPASKEFSSIKVCQCASPKLTELVAKFDETTPRELRIKALQIVKSCDPTAKLSPEEYKRLSDSIIVNKVLPPSDKGKFSLEIRDDKDPSYESIAKYLRKNGRLQDIVNAMNASLKIPYDIKIIATTGSDIIPGMFGPFYYDDEKTIYLDYKLMALQLEWYDKYHPDESLENRRHYFNNVTRFLLYHELGHALIKAYHLPVLGQEEDAADALAAVISLKYLPKGYQVLVDSADFFSLLDKFRKENNAIGEDNYWDVHSLDKQRYYRMLCFAYGESPVLVEDKIRHYYKTGLNDFISDHGSYCHYGYNDTYYSWMFLLDPYLKAPEEKASDDSEAAGEAAGEAQSEGDAQTEGDAQ